MRMSRNDTSERATHRFVHPINEHPIPLDQGKIDDIWADHDHVPDEPPHIDAAHEDYTRTIAERGEWHAFRAEYPFDWGNDVYVWNSAFGTGFRIRDEEGSWHELVNLFADIVDAEGDCRDAEYSSSGMPSGCLDQSCKECGQSWVIG